MEIIIGILLSALVSFLAPLVDKLANWIVVKTNMDIEDAKKTIIAVSAVLIAIVMWLVGDKGFWQGFLENAVIILSIAAGYYEYLYKAIYLNLIKGKSLEEVGNKLIK